MNGNLENKLSIYNIGIFVGSLRKEAFSRKMANAVSAMLPEDFKPAIVEIDRLELYNEDLDVDGQVPECWKTFRAKVRALDAVLFITPEYNRSVTPALKNALDVASRPMGQNAWGGKPGAIISITPGKLGAFGANHHLRQALTFLNVLPMQQPEAYLSEAGAIFDEKGCVCNAHTKDFLKTFVEAYTAWVKKIVK